VPKVGHDASLEDVPHPALAHTDRPGRFGHPDPAQLGEHYPAPLVVVLVNCEPQVEVVGCDLAGPALLETVGLLTDESDHPRFHGPPTEQPDGLRAKVAIS
jgi:hypothetical protein